VGQAARGYKWRDAWPGNDLAVKHGARSPRIVSERAEELLAGLAHERPDLLAYPLAVEAWSRAESRVQIVEDYVAQHGLLDPAGKPHGVLRYVAAWERLAKELRDDLGLSPRAEAALARERANARATSLDLGELRARGREVLTNANARDESREREIARLEEGGYTTRPRHAPPTRARRQRRSGRAALTRASP